MHEVGTDLYPQFALLIDTSPSVVVELLDFSIRAGSVSDTILILRANLVVVNSFMGY